MKTLKTVLTFVTIFVLYSCSDSNNLTDATGVFESTEVIISAEASGKIITFNLREGANVEKDKKIGLIDTTQLYLSKLKATSNREALLASKPNVKVQLNAIEKEIKHYESEKKRIEKLLEGDVATQKQLDDINSQLNVLKAKLNAQKNSLFTNVNALDAQIKGTEVSIAQIEDRISKSIIKSPIDGTVLVKYAEEGELTGTGKALFKVADMDNMILRAYVTSDQLANLKIGETVQVLAEFGQTETKEYEGIIDWVSSKAEFTPKTIQTQDERANLVYAVKISVKNDNYLKIGMYGGFILNNSAN